LIESNRYRAEVAAAAAYPLEWEKLSGRSLLITGATGMIGSFLIDVIMSKPELGCKIYAVGRNAARAAERFSGYEDGGLFRFITADINKPFDMGGEKMDYVFHAASNTHPVAYATDPIGTVMTNIQGTYNMLEFAASHKAERFVFASSVEVYGENRGDTERFSEDYCGYIDCNTLRAGYPEGKRAGEALCQAFIKQKGLDAVMPRLSRTYGPTMLMSDTKAISQFIKKGAAGEDIVLKSEGTQLYSYSYVADAAAAVLVCLLRGVCGEAYNVADAGSDITLRDLAGIIAEYTGRRVVFELPDETERAGYSKATKAILDSSKLKALGWEALYDMKKGLLRTVDIIREVYFQGG